MGDEIVWLSAGSPREYYRRVAELHAEQIPAALLAAFGPDFLERFYRRAVRHPATVLLVSTRDGHVTGFAFGSADAPSLNRMLLFWLWPFILFQLVRKPMLIGRVVALARYLRAAPRQPEAELLAIALHPWMQRADTGQSLLREFELKLLGFEIYKFRAVVSDTQPQALKFYRKHGGVVTAQTNCGGRIWSTFELSTV